MQIKLKLAAFLLLFAFSSAQAASENLISLTSQKSPGKTAYIGITTDAKNAISTIYYKGADGKILYNYPISALSSFKPFYSHGGRDLVFIKMPSSASTNQIPLHLRFVKNVFDSKEIGSRFFVIKYNASLSKYEIQDEDRRQFSSAYVTTHRNSCGFAVGIDEIQTQ